MIMTRTILIAEDSRTQAFQLQHLLKHNNYEVIVAADGQKAAELLFKSNGEKPSLVISDIMMPVMNGFELCRLIKSHEDTCGLPVILLTSLVDPEEIIEGLSCGADSFITKPYNEKYLLAHIERLISEDAVPGEPTESFEVQIPFEGKVRFIQAEVHQVIKLLLNVYEGAIQQNVSLVRTRDELRSLNESLETLVKKRTTELDARNTELQIINAEKDKLFSIIAHDLKSPFNALLGFSELLVEGAGNLSPEKIGNMARRIHQSADDLYKLLENLLNWSFVQRGLTEFTPVLHDLSETVNETLSLYSLPVEKKQITVHNYVRSGTWVTADARMLQVILRNLVSNAIKFSYRNGEITIKAGEKSMRELEISVKDEGIGMPENIRNSLFRIGPESTRKGTDREPGTGLGLLLCKDYVERQGGSIRLDSAEDRGTTFYFTIPRASP
jgi:signal transduction histidine kinase